MEISQETLVICALRDRPKIYVVLLEVGEKSPKYYARLQGRGTPKNLLIQKKILNQKLFFCHIWSGVCILDDGVVEVVVVVYVVVAIIVLKLASPCVTGYHHPDVLTVSSEGGSASAKTYMMGTYKKSGKEYNGHPTWIHKDPVQNQELFYTSGQNHF